MTTSPSRRQRWRALAMAMGTILATVSLIPGAPPGAAQSTGCPPGVDDPNLAWTDVSPISKFSESNLRDVFFLDTEKGWTVSSRGEIFFTKNGGADWDVPERILDVAVPGQPDRDLDVTGESFGHVFFVNERQGWVAASQYGGSLAPTNPDERWDPGLVLHTADGGVTWRRQRLPDPRTVPSLAQLPYVILTDVSFAQPEPDGPVFGWIGATEGFRNTQGALFATTDGGNTWTVTDPGRAIQEVELFDDRNGLLLSGWKESDGIDTKQDAAIFATNDFGVQGAASWSLERENLGVDGKIRRLAFSDHFNGLAVWTRNSGGSKVSLRAKAGGRGRIWGRQSDMCNEPGQLEIDVVDGRNCRSDEPGCNAITAQDFGPKWSRTTDGAKTWTPSLEPALVKVGPEAVRFVFGYGVSYPHPTVAYVSGDDLVGPKVYKATITFVEVTAVKPPTAPLCGGEVTIEGKHFGSDSTVTIGGVNAPVVPGSFKDGDDAAGTPDELKVIAPPANLPGQVHVIVTTPELGSSLPTASAKFEYLNPDLLPPLVQRVSPNEDKLVGGETVTIAGQRLNCATGVIFRDSVGKSVSATDVKVVPNAADPANPAVTVTVPAWGSSSAADVPVDVVVFTVGLAGVEVPSLPASPEADDFTYLGLPVIAGINQGGSALGGTKVTITGTGFEGRSGDPRPDVRIDDRPAKVLSVAGDGRSVAVEVPPLAAGKDPGRNFEVTLSTAKRGTAGPFNSFAYHPGVRGILPSGGLITGGESRTVTGAGLFTADQVLIGGQEAQILERIRGDDGDALVVSTPARDAPESVPVQVVATGLASLESVFFGYEGIKNDPPDDGDPDPGPAPRQGTSPQPAPPGGTGSGAPGASASPSPSPSPSPAPGASASPSPSPAPGASPSPGASASGAGSPSASGAGSPSGSGAGSPAPGQAPGQAPSSAGAGAAGAGAAPAPGPTAAPAQAGPGSGQAGAGGDEERQERTMPRHNMTAADIALGLGGAGAAMCFSALGLRHRRRAARNRPRPRGAY